jgi:hypothetical protein
LSCSEVKLELEVTVPWEHKRVILDEHFVQVSVPLSLLLSYWGLIGKFSGCLHICVSNQALVVKHTNSQFHPSLKSKRNRNALPRSALAQSFQLDGHFECCDRPGVSRRICLLKLFLLSSILASQENPLLEDVPDTCIITA